MLWPPHEVNYIVCLIHSKALVGEVPDTDHRGKETELRACASESAFDPSSGSPGADMALATEPTQRVVILQGFEATGEGRALGRGSGAAVGEKRLHPARCNAFNCMSAFWSMVDMRA